MFSVSRPFSFLYVFVFRTIFVHVPFSFMYLFSFHTFFVFVPFPFSYHFRFCNFSFEHLFRSVLYLFVFFCFYLSLLVSFRFFTYLSFLVPFRFVHLFVYVRPLRFSYLFIFRTFSVLYLVVFVYLFMASGILCSLYLFFDTVVVMPRYSGASCQTAVPAPKDTALARRPLRTLW